MTSLTSSTACGTGHNAAAAQLMAASRHGAAVAVRARRSRPAPVAGDRPGGKIWRAAPDPLCQTYLRSAGRQVPVPVRRARRPGTGLLRNRQARFRWHGTPDERC